MNELLETLDNTLATLYDYEYIDLDKFYNYDENSDLLEILDTALRRGYAKFEDMEYLQELHDNLDSFIKIETNHNLSLGDF